jgi:hypothetical protein
MTRVPSGSGFSHPFASSPPAPPQTGVAQNAPQNNAVMMVVAAAFADSAYPAHGNATARLEDL